MDKAGELAAHWRGHVDAWRASGGSQKAYCEQHGLRSHSLSYWHRRLAKGPGPSGARVRSGFVPQRRICSAVFPGVQGAEPLARTGWRLTDDKLACRSGACDPCGQRSR